MQTSDLYTKDFLFELHTTPELYTYGVMLELPGNYRLMEDIVVPCNPYLTYRFLVAIFICDDKVNLNMNNKTILLSGEHQIAFYCVDSRDSSISHGTISRRQFSNTRGWWLSEGCRFSFTNVNFADLESRSTMEEKIRFQCVYRKHLNFVLDWQEQGLYFIVLDYLECDEPSQMDWFDDHQLMATQLLQSVRPCCTSCRIL